MIDERIAGGIIERQLSPQKRPDAWRGGLLPAGTSNPFYMERVETKYEVGIGAGELPALWLDLSRNVPLTEFIPGQPITLVNTVYFDNDQHALFRRSSSSGGDEMRVRVRTYEYPSAPHLPPSDYWMEVKVGLDRVIKTRFRIPRDFLMDFLEGRNVEDALIAANNHDQTDAPTIRRFYQDTRQVLDGLRLKPVLLVTYQRAAFGNGPERVSLDWKTRYYQADSRILREASWLVPPAEPAGQERSILMELKCPRGAVPAWLPALQNRFPMRERSGYAKFHRGMTYVLQPGHGQLLTSRPRRPGRLWPTPENEVK